MRRGGTPIRDVRRISLKKEYASPGMARVQLKAEEAVLTACKTWSNSGTGAFMPGGSPPGFGNCNATQGGNDRCNILGS